MNKNSRERKKLVRLRKILELKNTAISRAEINFLYNEYDSWKRGSASRVFLKRSIDNFEDFFINNLRLIDKDSRGIIKKCIRLEKKLNFHPNTRKHGLKKLR